ncbi:hypothetical protein TNCV_1253801 [Trichonephila clavipes]|nr:hypothetical protein TNCV_1253801 [Trichonephila clavipes]
MSRSKPRSPVHWSVAARKMTRHERWRDSPLEPMPTVPNSVYATLGPEVHKQMFRSGGQSNAKPPVIRTYSHQEGPPTEQQAQLEDRFQEIWILTDSRASIQHLANWGGIGDQTSLDMLSLLHDLS